MTDHTRKFLNQPRPGTEPLRPAWADETLSDEQLCKLLNIGRDTLERMRRRGTFPEPDLRLGSGNKRWKKRTFRETYQRWLDQARTRAGE